MHYEKAPINYAKSNNNITDPLREHSSITNIDSNRVFRKFRKISKQTKSILQNNWKIERTEEIQHENAHLSMIINKFNDLKVWQSHLPETHQTGKSNQFDPLSNNIALKANFKNQDVIKTYS